LGSGSTNHEGGSNENYKVLKLHPETVAGGFHSGSLVADYSTVFLPGNPEIKTASSQAVFAPYESGCSGPDYEDD
jgi:hypothetical protein